MANDIRDIKPPMEIPDGLGMAVVDARRAGRPGCCYCSPGGISNKRVTQVSVAAAGSGAHPRETKIGRSAGAHFPAKPFCILVSDTVRFYLEERFKFHAPERTTEEFLRELGDTDLLADEQKESLGRFLESCDLVKFAKYEPGENELRELHRFRGATGRRNRAEES